MSKHLLFLVHGMGEHAEGWEKPIEKALIRLSNQYAAFQSEPLTDRVTFKAIRYDQAFESAMAGWRAAGSGVADFARGKDLAYVGDLDWLAEFSTEKTGFFWTHIVDVLIYRMFALERTAVRAAVAAALAKGVDTLLDEDPQGRASVLSHSLGTAVSHDAIHALGSQEFEIPDLSNALGPKHWRFHSLFTLANVSRIMATDIDPYRSLARPGGTGTASSYCEEFYNFRHELDPFPFPMRFDPPQWGDRFSSETIRSLHHWNPHGFLHYLEHPRVHVPIFRALAGFRSVKSSEYEAAIEKHETDLDVLKIAEDQLDPADAARVRELLRELEAVKIGLLERPSFPDAMMMVQKAADLLTELRELLEGVIEGFEF